MESALRAWVLLGALMGGMAAGIGVQPSARALGFTFNGVSNRLITPNGDGRNDNVYFSFTNPRDAGGSVKIYDVRGRCVATLTVNPGDAFEIWDARVNGAVAPAGVYVFVVNVEGATYSGTLAVVR